MRKFILICILILTSTGCHSNLQLAIGEQETLIHDFEQNGLSLQANIKIGRDINVNASITNNSGETIIYNGRCGIPFIISVKKEDAHFSLAPRGEKEEDCNAVFDPNDLKEMKPNESFDKEMTFKREVSLTNRRTVSALSGTYRVLFSFQMHDKESFISSLPFDLKMDNKPEVLIIDQVKAISKANKEVMKWIDKQEKEGMSIEFEDPILSDGMWTAMFHAIYKDQDGANRIIINMDAKSGDIKGIHYEELDREVLDFLNK